MKTQISKLFFVFGAVIVSFGLFSPINAQAQQTTFNTMSNDRPVIQVSNYTNNPNCSSCWSNSVSADPGDIVSVYIYYHNTGTVTANNTKLKITNNSQGFDSTQHTISGSVSASNASTVNGTSTINLSQSESLVFDNYIRWYPNHDVTNADPIPFGQNGTEVFNSGGLNIGNIAPDSPLGSFSTQGSLVVRFRVTDTPLPPPPPPPTPSCTINSFTAGQYSNISYGGSTTLYWSTSNCSNVSISGGNLNQNNLSPNGQTNSGSIFGQTIFTITATGQNGSDTDQITLFANSQQTICKINDFAATPKSINYGDHTTLSWDTTNCSYVNITGGNTNLYNQNYDGSKYIGPIYTDTTYTLTAYGASGNVQETETVYVFGSGSNGNCTIDYFYANPDEVEEGEHSTLYWATSNCDDVDISNGVGDVGSDGSKTVFNLFEDETYTIYGTGSQGNDQMTITIEVNEDIGNDCQIDSFYASPDEIDEGEDTTLYWATTDCDDVDISNGVGDVSDDGHEDINNLYEDETYTLTATGNNGSDQMTITVEVNEDNNNNDDDCEIDSFYASPDEIDEGEDTTLYWSTSNCDDVEINNGIGDVSDDGHETTDDLFEDETFTLYATGDNGSDTRTITVEVDEDDNNNDDDCEIDDFYASPSSVTSGDSTRLYWETTDCDDVYISNGVGNVNDDGNERINNIYSTTTYTITAHGDGGSDSDSATVYVNETPIYSTTGVTTLGVQNVTKTSADLVGVLVNTGGTANVWFEWGTTTSLGNSTIQSPYSGNVNTTFIKTLTGLNQDTLYYFRAVASGQNGRVEGSIRYFRTAGATGPTVINDVVYVNSGTGESLVDLDITSAFENVSNGESFDININYVNTSSSVVAKDTILTIVLPQNLIFERISRGEYNKTDHTVFADLEDIDPKEEGEIILKVKVGSKAQDGELLVTVGTLNYEKSNNKKEEVIDILTNKVSNDGSVLGAFALGGGFWPNTLLGWLLLLVVFMMIMYIASRMFRRKNIAQPMSVPVPPQNYR